MLQQIITVTLPETTVRRLQRAAELTHRSLDEVLDAALNVALSAPPDAPPALADELATMASFSDEALWTAAKAALPPADQNRLEELSHTGGARGLVPAEATELADLVGLHDQIVLRRAKALALLAFRGYALPAD